jgi:hypothetical protein
MIKTYNLIPFPLRVLPLAALALVAFMYFMNKSTVELLLIFTILSIILNTIKVIYETDKENNELKIYNKFIFIKFKVKTAKPSSIALVTREVERIMGKPGTEIHINDLYYELQIMEDNNADVIFSYSNTKDKVDELSNFISENLGLEIERNHIFVNNIFYDENKIKVRIGSNMKGKFKKKKRS